MQVKNLLWGLYISLYSDSSSLSVSTSTSLPLSSQKDIQYLWVAKEGEHVLSAKEIGLYENLEFHIMLEPRLVSMNATQNRTISSQTGELLYDIASVNAQDLYIDQSLNGNHPGYQSVLNLKTQHPLLIKHELRQIHLPFAQNRARLLLTYDVSQYFSAQTGNVALQLLVPAISLQLDDPFVFNNLEGFKNHRVVFLLQTISRENETHSKITEHYLSRAQKIETYNTTRMYTWSISPSVSTETQKEELLLLEQKGLKYNKGDLSARICRNVIPKAFMPDNDRFKNTEGRLPLTLNPQDTIICKMFNLSHDTFYESSVRPGEWFKEEVKPRRNSFLKRGSGTDCPIRIVTTFMGPTIKCHLHFENATLLKIVLVVRDYDQTLTSLVRQENKSI